MTKFKWILLIVAITGAVILILPDKGKPIIVFNKMHGPSFQDLIGLGLISICWLAGVFIIVRNWNNIKMSIGAKNTILFIAFYLIACFGVATALRIESDWILWAGVTIASFINILFIYLAFAKK